MILAGREEAEAGGFCLEGQPEQLSETTSVKILKCKNKAGVQASWSAHTLACINPRVQYTPPPKKGSGLGGMRGFSKNLHFYEIVFPSTKA